MASVREDQVEAAMRFLGNEKVANRPIEEKREFMLKKGLTEDEIDEAVRRYESGGATSTPSAGITSPAGGGSTAPPPSYPLPPAAQAPAYGAYPPAQWQGQGMAPYGPPGSQWPPGVPAMPPNGPPSPYGWMQPPPLYEAPQSAGTVPGWLWALGGVAAGLGGTLMASSFGRASQEKLVQNTSEGNAGWAHQQQQANGVLSHHKPQVQQNVQALEPPHASKPDIVTIGTDGGKPISDEGEKDEKSTKEVYEDLLALLRQHGDEAKETSALFRKAITQSQEQYQTMFSEMQKVLNVQAQQQKTQKSVPTDLSAATLQSLASLIECAKSGQPVVEGAEVSTAVPSSISGAANPLRKSLDATSQSLNHLVNESTSKAEASKTLNTLSLILQNLLGNPSSDKHRKVNTSSNRFAALAQGPNAELLKLAGFELQGQSFVLAPEQSLEAAERVRDLVSAKQRTLDEDWEHRPIVESGAEASAAIGGVAPDERQEDDTARANVSPASGSREQSTPSDEALANTSAESHSSPVSQMSRPPHSAAAVIGAQGVSGGGQATVAHPAAATHGAPTEGGNDGRRAARPWETPRSQKLATAVPPRPWESASTPAAASATPQGGGGGPAVEEDSQQAPSFSGDIQMQTPNPSVTAMPMAHPAESQSMAHPAHPAESPDASQGQPIAHPAEAASTHPAESPDSGQGHSIAHPAEAEDLAQPPPQTLPQQQPQHSNTPTVAHPAEGNTVSDEPQSGG